MEKILYKIILLLFIITNLYSIDLIKLYKEQGIEAVEEKLEESLRKTSYWEKYLEGKQLDYGYYESKEYILVTTKQNKQIKLFKNENDSFKLLMKDEVIVGEIEGDKQIEGDKKTPEGAYDLTEKKTNLDSFYGPFALVTSYPNKFDRSLDKNGYGIWIHGMPLNEEREKFTRGCIALDNPNLESLYSKIDLNKTVLLTANEQLKKASKDEIALILSSIYKWKEYWKKSDLENYLSFYSKEFSKADGTKYEKFARFKKYVFDKKEKKKIKFSNINIVPYPNSLNKKMYKVMMDQIYKSPAVNFKGKKELFLEIKENKVQILTEG